MVYLQIEEYRIPIGNFSFVYDYTKNEELFGKFYEAEKNLKVDYMDFAHKIRIAFEAFAIEEEARKRKQKENNNLYQVYCTHSVRPFEDEDMANAYFDWGCSEIEKGNYDKAIEYFEEAVTRGDVRSIDALMDTYKEIADILETQEDINLYWKYKLQMARKMQECGKILEDEITSGRVF